MGHSKTRTNLAHKLKSKRSARIGVLILMGGMLALITEAQFEPRTVKVARVIDGDTIQVLSDGRTVHRALDRSRHARDEAPDQDRAALWGRGQRLHHSGSRRPHSAARDRPHRRDRGPLWALASLRLPGRPETSTPRLIREGYGHAIRRFRYSLKTQFIRLEDSARKAGRGLWSPR